MTEPRRSMIIALKTAGTMDIEALAERVGISYEGTRQHLRQLMSDGWVARHLARERSSPGRPRSSFRLTNAGEHLFPKGYDDLAVALLDATADTLGPKAVHTLLEEVARRKVDQWQPLLRNLSLDQRLQALRDIYATNDPHCRVEYGDRDAPQLVEMNRPYLEVARKRPALCSITVSVLRRLLGHEVVRTERFQHGDGRCVFQVQTGRRVDPERALFEVEQD